MGFFSDLPDEPKSNDNNEEASEDKDDDKIPETFKKKRKDKLSHSEPSALSFTDKKPSYTIEGIVESYLNNLESEEPDVYRAIYSQPRNDIKKDKLKQKVKEISRKEAKRNRVNAVTEQRLQKDIDQQIFEAAPEPQSGIAFEDMGLSTQVMQALEKMNYSTPTPIQASTIPLALQGRDICGCASTGTGKTLAFMLPVIERLLYRSKDDNVTRVLVLVPTRELGIQVYDVAKDLASFTDIKVSISVGGLLITDQQKELCESPDIIIATPGRLIAHIYKMKTFSLKDVEILILDEADRMLDENFSEQLKEIINKCCSTHQTMLFSATMTEEVKELAVLSLDRPLRVFVNNNTQVAQHLRQEFVGIQSEDNRLPVLCYLVKNVYKNRTMIFVNFKTECHFLHIVLCILGLKCAELHGDKKQVERLEALEDFRRGAVDFLIATDVAARGLDIQGVETVINYHMPNNYKQYVHRVGRTARAGDSGCSLSIFCRRTLEDSKYMRMIRKNSLEPLKERIIYSENILFFKTKLNKIKKLTDIVKRKFAELQLEYNIKNKANKMKKKISNIGKGDDYGSISWFRQQKSSQESENAKETRGKKRKFQRTSSAKFLSTSQKSGNKSSKSFVKNKKFKK